MGDIAEFFAYLMIVLGAVVCLPMLWLVRCYNNLQRLSQTVQQDFSNLQAGMKTKIDLASQLMEIAKGYADHEALTHITIADRESRPQGAGGGVQGAFGAFSQMARAYPDLKADKSFRTLMKDLEAVEKDVLQRRETYNATANRYNTHRSTIPMIFIAKRLGFENAPYYTDELSDLELFSSDSGMLLKEMLGEFRTSIENQSKKIGATIGDASKNLNAGISQQIEHLMKPDNMATTKADAETETSDGTTKG